MSKQIAAIVHHLCPICAKKDDGEILLSTRFQDISKLDNQNVGFGKPCAECQAGIDMGAIMIIVVDQEKSGDMTKPEEWFRTGIIHGVKQQYIEKLLEKDPEMLSSVLKKRATIMDYKLAKNLGFPIDYPKT